MKKVLIPALAAVTALVPMAASSAFADPPRRQEARNDRNDRNERQDVHRSRGARDNGYWANGRFYRGAPTAAQMRARDFRFAQRQWQRGERLSAWDRQHYVRVTNYRQYRLAAPPRGYEYRRSNSGEIILAAVATGIILQVLLNR